MQRLGFCKAVLVFSTLARTPSDMSDTLRMKLEGDRFTVPYDEGLAAWLKDSDNDNELNPGISVSLQKLYVYGHPSRTGWLSRRGFNEYVEYLPQRFGLVTGSYELTDMGNLLSHFLVSSSEREAFNRPSTSNPLILTLAQKIFFLYVLLAADGDFLLTLCDAMLESFGGKPFNYLDVGSLVPKAIREILNRFSGSAYTQLDREQLRKLEAARGRILEETEKNIEKAGSGSRREQTTIPRLGWLVDLGLANWLGSRTWGFTECGLELAVLVQTYEAELARKYPENVISTLLDSHFFVFVAHVYAKQPCQSIGREEFLTFIRPAYTQLAGIGGYCLLRPLVLYANIQSMIGQKRLFVEYDKARELLEEIYQSNPKAVTYTIDRFNTDYQIRIEKVPDQSKP